MTEPVATLFADLCAISSPTGEERAIADRLSAELRDAGAAEVIEDDAAGPARAGAGNLIARFPGSGDRWLAFFAHMDTVPHDGPIEVVSEDGVFRSAGETILGADNKAAVAVLLELARDHDAEAGVELVITVAEEDGLRGAHYLDVSALRSERGYVLDHASPVGEVIVASPTYRRFEAEFIGAEAHAGIRPEQGSSAIEAAAAAIAEMELGRLDPGTTANLGVISGGSALNVVPGRCLIEGEARSLDGDRVVEVAGRMVDACMWAAGEHSCDVRTDSSEFFRGYRLDSDAPAVAAAAVALEAEGFGASMVESGGGSDANALIAAGFDCVLLANGTTDNHTSDESVSEAALTGMLAVCRRLVADFGRGA